MAQARIVTLTLRTCQQAEETEEEMVLTYELISSAKEMTKETSSHTVYEPPASSQDTVRLDIEVPDIDWYI